MIVIVSIGFIYGGIPRSVYCLRRYPIINKRLSPFRRGCCVSNSILIDTVALIKFPLVVQGGTLAWSQLLLLVMGFLRGVLILVGIGVR